MTSFQSLSTNLAITAVAGKVLSGAINQKASKSAKAAVSGLGNVPNAGNSGTSTSSVDLNVKSNASNKAYQIIITCYDLNIVAVGYLPENFSIQVGSTFGAPFADTSGYSLLPNNKLSEALPALTGSTALIQEQTVLIWQGSGGAEFSLPLQVVANDSVLKEITQPYLDLSELCVPYQKEGDYIMKTPGPQWNAAQSLGAAVSDIGNAAIAGIKAEFSGSSPIGSTTTPNSSNTLGFSLKNDFKKGFKNRTQVLIGDYLHLDNVVVKNVDMNLEALMIADSQPSVKDGGPGKATITVSFQTMFNITIQDLYKMFQLDSTKTRTDLANSRRG